ncbi:MAG: hemerythrin domain-containing protein [bacterium]
MKREKFMWPLSQSHHRALLTARRVREALPAGIVGAERVKKTGEEVRVFFDQEMRQHFLDEEKILSMLETRVDKNDQDFARIRSDHKLLESLSRSGERDALLRFSEVLVAHIRFEEDVVFGRLEAKLTEDEKLEIGKLLEEHNGSR